MVKLASPQSLEGATTQDPIPTSTPLVDQNYSDPDPLYSIEPEPVTTSAPLVDQNYSDPDQLYSIEPEPATTPTPSKPKEVASPSGFNLMGALSDYGRGVSSLIHGTNESLNSTIDDVKNRATKTKDNLVSAGIGYVKDVADRSFRERFNVRKGIPSSEAATNLVSRVPLEDILRGRLNPGMAKRDFQGNIMSATYPSRVEGRRPNDMYVKPREEKGFTGVEDFVGPPQLPGLSRASYDYAKSKYFDMRHKDTDFGLEGMQRGYRGALYMPDVVMQDMDSRHKEFGPTLGFTSQSEYDEHVKGLIDNEKRFRDEEFRQKNLDELKEGLGFIASAAGGAYAPLMTTLANIAYNTARSGDRSLESGYQKLYEPLIDNPEGSANARKALNSYVSRVQNSPTEKKHYLDDAAQLAYSLNEEGRYGEAYNRLKQIAEGVRGFDTGTPTGRVSGESTWESLGLLAPSIVNYSNELTKLRGYSGKGTEEGKENPYTSLRGAAYMGLSDLDNALLNLQMRNNDITKEDLLKASLQLGVGSVSNMGKYYMANPEVAAGQAAALATYAIPALRPLQPVVGPITRAIPGRRQRDEDQRHRADMRYRRTKGNSRSFTNTAGLSAIKDLLSSTGRSALSGEQTSGLGAIVNKTINERAAPAAQDILRENYLDQNKGRYLAPAGGERTYAASLRPTVEAGTMAVTNMDNVVTPISRATLAYRTARPFVEPYIGPAVDNLRQRVSRITANQATNQETNR
jgi:hypothetical protein